MPKSTEYEAKQPDADGFIAYTPEEDAVWADLVARQMPAVRRDMARPYLDGLAKLDLPTARVPQCPEVSERLRDLTGWRVEPVPALIGFGRFFGMLADRTFPAASFIRKRKHFDYIEEPDIFHEIFGHTPLLTDPAFAAFSQAIGQAGDQVVECATITGASDYLLKIVAEDAEGLERFLMRRLLATGIIRATVTNFVLRQTKYTTALPV